MRKLNEIAADIRNRIASDFPTVRFSTASVSAQLINEIEAISVNKLPAVIVTVDQAAYTRNNRVREQNVSLVLVDRFIAGSDERAQSAWLACEKLIAHFPAEGIVVNDVAYLPEQLSSVPVDSQYVSFTIRLRLQQRT